MSDASEPTVRRESPELRAALDSGELRELPPNVPPGLLGEVAPDLRKVDGDRFGLNAGLTQEMDGPVVLMLVIISYAVFFPLAFWILWRTDKLPRVTKVGFSVVMAVGVVAATVYLAVFWRPA
jgi:hypothetical protein